MDPRQQHQQQLGLPSQLWCAQCPPHGVPPTSYFNSGQDDKNKLPPQQQFGVPQASAERNSNTMDWHPGQGHQASSWSPMHASLDPRQGQSQQSCMDYGYSYVPQPPLGPSDHGASFPRLDCLLPPTQPPSDCVQQLPPWSPCPLEPKLPQQMFVPPSTLSDNPRQAAWPSASYSYMAPPQQGCSSSTSKNSSTNTGSTSSYPTPALAVPYPSIAMHSGTADTSKPPPGWEATSMGSYAARGSQMAPADGVGSNISDSSSWRELHGRGDDVKTDRSGSCGRPKRHSIPAQAKRSSGFAMPVGNETNTSEKRGRKASQREGWGSGSASSGKRGHDRAHKRHHQAPRRQALAKPSRPPASAACMSALALTAVSGFAPVERLERTCVELSNACREGAPWMVKVELVGMPPRLSKQFWRARKDAVSKSTTEQCEKLAEAVVKRGKRVHDAPEPTPSRLIPRRVVKRLTVVRDCDVSDLIWPTALEKVDFCDFDSDIEHAVWPSTLTTVKFRGFFNRPVEAVAWPPGLRVLEMSNSFDQPVEEIALPDSVEHIVFGHYFSMPIARVKWPARLRELEFGAMFNKPLDGVSWPDTLRRLTFRGPFFNQPIHRSPLPRDLTMLKLGDGFDQPLGDVVWPMGIKEVDLGDSFEQDMRAVVWPKSLLTITAPDMELGQVPPSCNVIVLRNLQQQIEDDVASMLSHFMMMDGYAFFHPFHFVDPFAGMHEGDTDSD